MGRKRLVPATDYGRSLYDWYKYQRREDGSTWELEDLSEWLSAHGVSISGKQLGEWVKGKYPKLDMAAAICELFGVTLDAMWRHASNPINLPQDERTATSSGSDGGDDERRKRDALVRDHHQQVKADTARSARPPRPAPPKRHRG